MGKVKDGAPASKASKPSKGGATGGGSKKRTELALFVTNLFSAKRHKPMQGRQARLYTAVSIGVLVVMGLWRLYEVLLPYSPLTRFGIPTALGLVFGWFTYRLVEFPPFVEFLIATEAEMNKVSWTTRDDLYRATTVVLSTVLLMSFYLFGVDWVWSNLLQLIGVLRFGGGGSFGSTAG